jgi:hypothetical protein
MLIASEPATYPVIVVARLCHRLLTVLAASVSLASKSFPLVPFKVARGSDSLRDSADCDRWRRFATIELATTIS